MTPEEMLERMARAAAPNEADGQVRYATMPLIHAALCEFVEIYKEEARLRGTKDPEWLLFRVMFFTITELELDE